MSIKNVEFEEDVPLCKDHPGKGLIYHYTPDANPYGPSQIPYCRVCGKQAYRYPLELA